MQVIFAVNLAGLTRLTLNKLMTTLKLAYEAYDFGLKLAYDLGQQLMQVSAG